jgi:hypothetical protein
MGAARSDLPRFWRAVALEQGSRLASENFESIECLS